MRKLTVLILCACSGLLVGQRRTEAQSSGLVAAFGFEEESGTQVNDRSGLGNHGTISGAARTTAGRFGKGLSFDGVNDWVTVASSTSLNVTTGVTIEAWVFPTREGGWQTAVLKEASGQLRYSLYTSSDQGTLSQYLRIGSTDRALYAPAALPLNDWTHVAATYDRTNMRLYVNGVQVASRGQTGNIATSAGALRLGGNGVWGEYFQGTLDEVRIYNRALSPAEIVDDMNTSVDPQSARLVIDAPANNATVTGPDIDVAYTVAGPLTGVEDHVHFVLDGVTVMDPPPMDGVYRFSNVTPGVHVLGGYLARANHSYVPGSDASPVTFTVLGPDLTPPMVTQTAPASGAMNVTAATSVIGTFSEAIDSATLTGATFQLFDASGVSVSSTVTFDAASLRAVLVPAAALSPSTSYTAVLMGGTGGIADAAGNVLAADVIWSFTTAAAPPPATGLVAAYGFNEGTGTSVNDLSGKGNHGNINGAAWDAAGRFGGALSFNGTSGTVTIPDAVSLDLTTGMTLEAWVYPTALSGYRTVMLREVPGELSYCLYANDNSPRPSAYINVGTVTDPAATGSAALPLNAWSHLVATYDGTTLRLFVNGSEVGSRQASGSLISSSSPLRIGGNAVWGEYFQGRIDEVRIYNRALSAAEIVADRDTPVAGAGGGLPDTTPPSVSLTAPAAGIVTGTVSLAAAASDDVGLQGVQFQVDGIDVGVQDTSAPYAVAWDTRAVSNGSHSVTAIARDAAGNTTTSAAVLVTVANGNDPSQVGSWSEPIELGMVAVHMTLLHTGKLLMWRGMDMGGQIAAVWDPVTHSMRAVPNSLTNLFCAGHSRLADGRILVVGGHDSDNGILGSADANIFDPITESWTAAPKMSQRRWYPTATTLPDGRVLVMSGGTTCFSCIADIPEIYDPLTNSWTRLTAARLAFPYYPFSFVLPDGTVLNAGAGEEPVATRLLNLATQSWTTVDPNVVDGGSAVMYRPGKILKTGTAATTDISNVPAAPTAYVLDMTAATPAWRQVASMARPRAYHNSTILPDGTVLITGGGSRTEGKNNGYAVYEAELWSPVTETFTTMASMRTPRQYHGTALLLPDGRVLVAGSGDSYGGPDQTVAEFYSPPYLFKGPRPAIASAPAEIQYGTSFEITSPNAEAISNVCLIRLGSVTHQFDEDQRYLDLVFTRSGNALTIQAPANANLAPPGHYMLFIVNSTGVPSIGAIVRFPSPAEDSEAPTAPSGLTAIASISDVALSWAASSDSTGVARYDIHRASTSGFVPDAATRIAQTAGTDYVDRGLVAGTYYYRVVAVDAAGNTSAASGEAAATVLPDVTPPSAAITSPVDGAVVSGTVQVQVNASDDGTVSGVQLRVDGVNVGSEDTTAPFAITWNSTSVPNGAHTVTVVARDSGGNVSESLPVLVSVSNASMPSGLIAAYAFDEGGGLQASDATGNGHVGDVVNATWTAAGRFGGALTFNGTSSAVSVADANDLDLGTAMTIEAWVRPTALTGWRTVLLKEAPNGLAYALYAHDQSRPAAYINLGGSDRGASGTAALALNTWTHGAMTYDGSVLRLFINGTQVRTLSASGIVRSTAGRLTIGGNSVWGEYFAGQIDEVRIYNRVLTAGEIQADMGNPVSNQ